MNLGHLHVGERGEWKPVGTVHSTLNFERILPDLPDYIDDEPTSISFTTTLPAEAVEWLMGPRCALCNSVLPATRPSDDFCGDWCQSLWYADRNGAPPTFPHYYR